MPQNKNETLTRGNSNVLSNKYIPIVLCAGFGTRLKPITDYIPKVICPIIDKPLAFFSIEKFLAAGFEKVYCNTHYLPHLVELELKACAKDFGYDSNRIVFFNEIEILGSGGGILNIITHLCNENPDNKKKDVIISSGDVVADFPLNTMLSTWENRKADELALMLSLPLTEKRDDILCVSKDLREVVGFGKIFLESSNETKAVPRLFSNHQIIAAEVLADCALKSESSVSLFYKKILNILNKKIIHVDYPSSLFWFNVGDLIEYEKCLKFFCEQKNLQFPTVNKMHMEEKYLNIPKENTFFLKLAGSRAQASG